MAVNEKHSQAPWGVNEFDDFDGDHHVTVCVESNGCPIAHLYEMGSEMRPNARLIAAAPDLLAALRELLSAGDDSVNAEDDVKAMLRFADAVSGAKTAIAKATGEQQ